MAGMGVWVLFYKFELLWDLQASETKLLQKMNVEHDFLNIQDYKKRPVLIVFH